MQGGYQVEMFYLDNANALQEFNFGAASGFANGSASPYGFKAGTNSSLTAIWPSFFYQDASSDLHEIYYYAPDVAWEQVTQFGESGTIPPPIPMKEQTGLAAFATDAAYSSINVFYQNTDGKLQQLKYDQTVGWSSGKFYRLSLKRSTL
jgi:hypothetical protein